MNSKFASSLKPNEHQDLLDRFQAGEVKEEELQEQYDRCSIPWAGNFRQTQFLGWVMKDFCWLHTHHCFDLPKSTRRQSSWRVVLCQSGKLSLRETLNQLPNKRYAKILMKEGEEEAYRQVRPKLEFYVIQDIRWLRLGTWIQKIRLREVSNITTSLNLYWQVSFAVNMWCTFTMMPDKGRRVGGEEPGEQWRRIFPAQVTTYHFIYYTSPSRKDRLGLNTFIAFVTAKQFRS